MKRRLSKAQWTLGAVILGIAAASLYRQFLYSTGLQDTAALYIGLPAILALILTFSPPAKSYTGIILKTITIALLLCGITFVEGFLCLLMSAPLFWAIGAIVGRVMDRRRKSKPDASPRSLQCMLALIFGVMSLEGTLPQLTFPREQTVTVTKVIAASPEAVRAQLAKTPRFRTPRPLYLRAGFPWPGETSGSGLNPGDLRVVELVAPIRKATGTLTLRVRDSGAKHVAFEFVEDKSHIPRWMDWTSSSVEWREVAPGRTEVSWTLGFSRKLDPAWYFGAWQRYAVELSAEYLIDNLATPVM